MRTQISCPACSSNLGLRADTPHGALGTCPICATQIQIVVHRPPPPPTHKSGATFADVLVGATVVVGVLAGGMMLHKCWQALTDHEFQTVEFPASFRHELIDEHIANHGSWCPGCEEIVDPDELNVDHIVAVRNGGLTSRHNAAVLCGRCNSSKGATNTRLDYLRGRRG